MGREQAHRRLELHHGEQAVPPSRPAGSAAPALGTAWPDPASDRLSAPVHGPASDLQRETLWREMKRQLRG